MENICKNFYVAIRKFLQFQQRLFVIITGLSFRRRASYIYADRSANLQMLNFIYLFNKYKY
jgi:hypothetical protein